MMDTLMSLFNDPTIILGLGEKATKILGTVGTIGGALVGIALVFSIVKDAMGYIKGSGSNSIGKIIGKVIMLIVMIGIIAVASTSTTFEQTGKRGAETLNKGIDAGLTDLQ